MATDGFIDALVIVWRRNSIYRKKRDGGSTSGGDVVGDIHNYGIDQIVRTCFNDVSKCIAHEISHLLLGGNIYHSGGAGDGKGKFLSNIGGYGILSSFNKNLISCNAWDRWRLGWKTADKQYYISALTCNGLTEVASDFVYGESLQDNEFILRDFTTTGDAIRIKLPYINEINNHTENQYLWIENHQLLPQTTEYDISKPSGIRFNIQIGNDNLYQGFLNSRTNYYVPLSYFGNHDFDYLCNPENVPLHRLTSDYYTARTSSDKANPFSGYHLSMLPAIDYITPHNDTIQGKEYVNVYDVFFNNTQILTEHPVFGNPYDAFPAGTSLSISANPPVTPVLTHNVINRMDDLTSFNSTPYDNRYILLNGLRIDIAERFSNGSIKVKIAWNDYNAEHDVRWCGDIVLFEEVHLKPNNKITIDQGYTPVKPTNPITFQGQKIFADPTSFTCREGSRILQEEHSTVDAIHNSTLILESGSVYEIDDNAVLNIREGATLHIKSGATSKIHGRGHIEVWSGGYICIEEGAIIVLNDVFSAVNPRLGHQTGLNPEIHGNIGSDCVDNLLELPVQGNGSINIFSRNEWIQNETIQSDRYVHGITVKAGYHVTNDRDPGNVVIEDGNTLIIDSEGDVLIDNGTEIESGASIEVRRPR